MLAFDELLKTLGYADSPHYRNRSSELQPETAHLFRSAFSTQVEGIYVFESSPIGELTVFDRRTLPDRPVVYLAVANNQDEAREIHRKLWNLGSAPFIIVKLPNQIRAYTGFEYDQADERIGQLGTADNLIELSRIIEVLSASAVDSGKLWDSDFANKIDDTQRVDRKLLESLRQLGDALKNDGLSNDLTHALIGKYVYFYYLLHRNILTTAWLNKQNIDQESIFSPNATLLGLRDLSQALEKRFNGQIFPIEFGNASRQSLQDKHVAWVASVFSGGNIYSNNSLPQEIIQLHLPFRAYDFSYIPVETLSTIYEQFIDERKEIGAVYTPEYLADYLLSEVEWVKPLDARGKILDPACGSGVFLVLAYRRLIEKELSRLGKDQVSPEKLKQILEQSIYGVERERDACFVTEFSLILTLLHYVEPPELEKLEFRFPNLHNQHIFHGDFFDVNGEESEASIWQRNLRFDWIIGNPPWTKDLHPERDKFARQWIKTKKYAVSWPRVAEAFSWQVTELINDEGIIGLLLPATSLFNANSRKYRQDFFTRNEVLRITNFANLREVLFGKGKSSVLPAVTMVYRPTKDINRRANILHYGPFIINQVAGNLDSPWTITINENEIKLLSATATRKGDSSFWKLALWGTHLDVDAVERIEYLFPKKLKDLCTKHRWHFHQSSELRSGTNPSVKVERVSWLTGKRQFNAKRVKNSPYRFSIDPYVLGDIPDDIQCIRVRGGRKGLNTTFAPHIIISPVWGRYIIYSDEDFVLPTRHVGIAEDKNYKTESSTYFLKAITVFLRSSLTAYYLFFRAPQWGVFRNARLVTTVEVGEIRVPDFTLEQAVSLAQFHDETVLREKEMIASLIQQSTQRSQVLLDSPHGGIPNIPKYNPRTQQSVNRRKPNKDLDSFRAEINNAIDHKIFGMFNIPEDIQLLAQDFVNIRLDLDSASKLERVTRHPNEKELLNYAEVLQKELDGFVMDTAFHSVAISYSSDLIECAIQINHERNEGSPASVIVQKSQQTKAQLMSQLRNSLRETLSQWVYVQRSLRLFDGSQAFIYKAPRLIDWTRTQALNDAGDIIGEVIAKPQLYEADHTYT